MRGVKPRGTCEMLSRTEAVPVSTAWGTFGLALILWAVHQLSGWRIGLELFRTMGGIQDAGGGWTSYGGIDYAWTNLAWLPAGPMLAAGNGFTSLGVLLVLLGSGAAAYTASALLSSLLASRRP